MGNGGRQPISSELVVVGKVLAPWGVRGEVKVEVMTDFPDRFAPGAVLYLGGQPVTIEQSRWHDNKVIVKLAGVDGRQAAEVLQGQFLEAPQAPLPPGEYYHFQLIGLEVWSDRGEYLGKISDVLTTASNDVYLVQGPGGEKLIPALEDAVRSIDLEKRLMIVEAWVL